MSVSIPESWLRAVAVGTGFALGGAGGILAWTQLERRSPVLRRYRVPVDVPPQVGAVNVLQISDLHLFTGQEFLVDFVRSLADQPIDLVLSTGDNFGSASALDLVLEAYEPLMRFPGAFVLGSNDYYSPRAKPWSSYLTGKAPAGLKPRKRPDLPWYELVQAWVGAGWVDLTNQAEVITIPPAASENGEVISPATRRIGLIGVDDPHIHRDRVPAVPQNWDHSAMLRLGVTHAPYQRVLNEFTALGVDAIFAGHTHGGQLCLPKFGAIVTNCDIPRRYASGLHRWGFGGNSAALHVCAGLGTSYYAPARFACRPEASLVTLVPRDLN